MADSVNALLQQQSSTHSPSIAPTHSRCSTVRLSLEDFKQKYKSGFFKEMELVALSSLSLGRRVVQ